MGHQTQTGWESKEQSCFPERNTPPHFYWVTQMLQKTLYMKTLHGVFIWSFNGNIFAFTFVFNFLQWVSVVANLEQQRDDCTSLHLEAIQTRWRWKKNTKNLRLSCFVFPSDTHVGSGSLKQHPALFPSFKSLLWKVIRWKSRLGKVESEWDQ